MDTSISYHFHLTNPISRATRGIRVHSSILPARHFEMIYFQLQVFLMIVSAINGLSDGPKASVGEFKYSVSIWKQKEPLCAGAIIHERYVLTAAHCVFQEIASDLSVYAGLIDLHDPNLIVTNVRTIHPYYGTEAIPRKNPGKFYFTNDIVILETAIAFSWSSTITPIPIVEAEQWDSCEPCLVPGWHISETADITVMYLSWVYVHVSSDRTCRELITPVYSNEKCVYDDLENGIALPGDSGTPVVCRGVVSGIIIRGYAERYKPTVILSVHLYREFIYQTIHDDTVDADPQEFPYVVSIWSNANYICGGIIFDHLHVITMAHCVKNFKKTDIRVLTGKRVLVEQYPVSDWSSVDSADLYLHYEKDYSEYSQNSITVLTLMEPVLWSPVIRGASLSIGNDPLPGQQCQVLQWSRKNLWWGDITRKLVWVPAVILSKQECEELGELVGSNEFCATSQYAYPLAFEEDSGNPIVCEGIVVGILASVPQTFSLFASSQGKFIRLFPYVGTIQFANSRG